jgi:hypothetical protein
MNVQADRFLILDEKGINIGIDLKRRPPTREIKLGDLLLRCNPK